MLVFVKNKHGENLMPCKPQKARKLLKNNKAKILSYQPFTIQLLHGSSGYKQEVQLGVDLGARFVGIALTTEDSVLVKGEVELRKDVSSLLESRNSYRRGRRTRNLRYRKRRFNNRKRKQGWLPPSIRSRIDNTFRWIDSFTSLVPSANLSIEVGKFDVQKMLNPDIQGVDYQHGQTYSYHDVRYFVLARDNYTCQVCKQKNKILNTHHIIYRSHGGSNRADNLITVCTDCHTYENHQEGNILWEWQQRNKKVSSYREIPFMNILRKRVFTKYPDARITYGSVTTPKRKELKLEKSHENDAIAISGIDSIKKNTPISFKIKQFRKKKRSLHEATARKGRKEPNRDSKRNKKNTPCQNGFFLNDQVKLFGQIGFVKGFTKGGLYVADIYGNYITKPSKTYKQVSFKDVEIIQHNNNWQFISHLLR